MASRFFGAAVSVFVYAMSFAQGALASSSVPEHPGDCFPSFLFGLSGGNRALDAEEFWDAFQFPELIAGHDAFHAYLRYEAQAHFENRMIGRALHPEEVDALFEIMKWLPARAPSNAWKEIQRIFRKGPWDAERVEALIDLALAEKAPAEPLHVARHFVALLKESAGKPKAAAPYLSTLDPLKRRKYLLHAIATQRESHTRAAFDYARLSRQLSVKDLEDTQFEVEQLAHHLGIAYRPDPQSGLTRIDQIVEETRWRGNPPYALYRRNQLLEVQPPYPTKKATGPLVNAFEHPDFPALQKKLSEKGYRIVIDPTISSPGSGLGGYFHGSQKVIALRPDSKWHTFLHEVEHFENHEGIVEWVGWKDLIETAPLVKTADMRMYRTKNPRVHRALQLAKKGLTETAIEETIAVEAEIKAFREAGMGVLDRNRIFVRRYALEHQIRELSAIAESQRTPVQKRTLARAKRLDAFYRQIDEKFYPAIDSLDRKAVRALTARGLVGAGLATAAGYVIYDVGFGSDDEPHYLVHDWLHGKWLEVGLGEGATR